MSVVVRNRPRRRYPLRRTARRLQAVLGGAMVAIGATTGMAVVIIPALVLVGLGSGSDGVSAQDSVILGQFGRGWALATLVTVSGLTTGRSLLRGRRRTVLWLRRFRDHEGIRVVSDALDHIGRSWRVVTLDDRAARPVGVAPGLRVASGALGGLRRTVPRLLDAAGAVAPLLTKACVAAIVVVVGWSVLQGRFFELLDGLGRSWDDWSGPPLVLALRVPVAILIAEFALLIAFIAVSLALIPILGVITVVGQVSDDVTKAEQVKTAQVRGLSDVERVADSVAQSGGSLLAPRLTVLTVDSDVWQQTVDALERRCSAVLVDVSQVSENLLWEVRRLADRSTGVVYVGERAAVTALATADGATSDGAAGGVTALRAALDGRDVLAYTTGWWGRIRFQQSLFADLEAAAARTRIDARAARRLVWRLVGTACLGYGLVQAVAFVRSLL